MPRDDWAYWPARGAACNEILNSHHRLLWETLREVKAVNLYYLNVVDVDCHLGLMRTEKLLELRDGLVERICALPAVQPRGHTRLHTFAALVADQLARRVDV
jgi:hypothetical protein